MKILPSSLFIKNTAPAPEPKSSSSSWPFSTCTQSRTNSFRIPVNEAYFDNANTPESFFTNSSEGCSSFSTTAVSGEDPTEAVINKGLRSERLFFKPDKTSSILDKVSIRVDAEETEDDNDDEVAADIPFEESVALSMDSTYPYVDFRKSMEEMVEVHGLKEWEQLEELLCWYLRVNGKSNHGYIIEAFVDLLVGLAFNSNSNDQYYSPSTPLSFNTTTSTTSCSSSSSTSTTCVSSIGNEEGSEMSTSTMPCLSSLLEAEDENTNEDDDDDGASS